MKKEPCIRLGMRIRPKIREKPDDNRNKRPPKAKLLMARMAACANVTCVMNGLSPDPPNATRLANRHARSPGSIQQIPGSETGNATDEQPPLFQIFRRRIVAPVDLF